MMLCGRLAQLVEHPLDVREVTGSSPVSSTTFKSRKALKTIVFGAFPYFLAHFEKADFSEKQLDNNLDNKLPEKRW